MSRILTLEVARIIAEAALAKCRADGLKVTVLVVDGLNAPKVLIRDDGAVAATAEAARMKATTAMLYNWPSGPTTLPPPGTPVPAAAIPGTFIAQGGVPIKVGDVTIGAIDISATQSPLGGQDKDAACGRRAAVMAWQLDVLCDDPREQSNTVTAVRIPEGHDADRLRQVILDACDMSLGTGLGRLGGQVFRIGHLGAFNDLILAGTLAGVELGLRLAGVPHCEGGVMAALEVLAAADSPETVASAGDANSVLV